MYPSDEKIIRRTKPDDPSDGYPTDQFEFFQFSDHAVSQTSFGSSFPISLFQNSNFDPTYWTLRRSLFLSLNDRVAAKMEVCGY